MISVLFVQMYANLPLATKVKVLFKIAKNDTLTKALENNTPESRVTYFRNLALMYTNWLIFWTLVLLFFHTLVHHGVARPKHWHSMFLFEIIFPAN